MKVYEVWKGALGIRIRPRAFRNQACWHGRHRYQCLRLARQSATDEVLPCPVTVQGDAALGQYGRKQNTRQVLEKWAAKNQAVSAYWLQSKLTAQENQTELAQAQTTDHKRNSAWWCSNTHNYPSLGANRESKTENIFQAYPGDADNFNYK